MARIVAKHALSDQLREVIASRGTAYAVAKSADVDPGVVQRFLTGERGLTVATLDKLAEALGLRLIEVGGRTKRPAIAAKRSPSRRPTVSRPPVDLIEDVGSGNILPGPMGGDGAAEGVDDADGSRVALRSSS